MATMTGLMDHAVHRFDRRGLARSYEQMVIMLIACTMDTMTIWSKLLARPLKSYLQKRTMEYRTLF